ncbi:MAG: phosphoadenylyl-sulfate reductase [Cyclobacteriaceae bacterium]|nr:phosphoadenylyl-sulfate reductase [Cyclobacteriaceae bacterium]MCK5368991.1 phosphoadenylyl-sulfate reductase [Cyclobacteriaceae bacterium]MCK5470707.1 phosphoadenylyl-sulfate reductase [Cyclobacteriaceae bacterium]
MDFEQIKKKIEGYLSDEKKIFTSSSFQTHSIPLLHMISRIEPSIPVYFLNTGYHFPETIEFRDQIVELLDLNLVDLKPDTPKNMQLDPEGKLLFASDPDHCCYLNKTQPMEQVLMRFDVWVNGIRAEQNAFRSDLKVEQSAKYDVIRFHPLIGWTGKDIYEYRKKFKLPEHPLESKGYFSIGCEPCTRKIDLEMQEREARWYGQNKTECGLNTDLVEK